MFEVNENEFFLDGKPFKIYSGAVHYFRVVPEYWEDRLKKLKAAGFNTVETYTCWNIHEPTENVYDFEGQADVAKFIEIAKNCGLYVIIRPGPYICAEWDFGALPAWLLKDKNLRLRCDEPLYTEKVERYLKKLYSVLKPHLITNGGNIIAMQIENEYGSYGNDKKYLARLERLAKDCGMDVLLFTADGCNGDMLSGGTLPHIYKTVTFGTYRPSNNTILDSQKLPKTCMEFWCGWFDHWGEKHHTRKGKSVAAQIKAMLDDGWNLNVYMFHGGTNFGFFAGANYMKKYQPTVTSYDYAAVLNEYGDYTSAYYAVRKALSEAQGKPEAELPPRPILQNVGKVELTEKGDLWSNLYVLGEKHESAATESMEYYGQNRGYILYRKKIVGKYGMHFLIVEGVHDIAYLKINGKLVKKYDRTKNGKKRFNDGFRVITAPFDGEMTLEILVEGMGRVNYGRELDDDRKGLLRVRLDYQTLYDWEVYTLPFDNLEKTVYGNAESGRPSILKGHFKAEKGKDCFVDTKGFTKGFVTVNGFNLGRYWSRGPQRSLYLPAPILKENNEIIVVEQEGYSAPFVDITDRHYL